MVAPDLTLADDYGGTIRRLALQVPSLLLQPENLGKREAYEHLLRRLSPCTELWLLTDVTELAAVQHWLSLLKIAAPIEIVTVPDGKVSAAKAWMRDAFLNGSEAGAPRYFRTQIGKLGGNQAEWLAAKDGTGILWLDDVYLDGGDSLVGLEFRLIGVRAAHFTQEIVGHQCDFATAVTRLAALDPRPMTLVGYRPGDISHKLLWFTGEVGRRMRESREEQRLRPLLQLPGAARIALRAITETLQLWRANSLIQNWAHIDVVVSITGQKQDGKDLLLVAKTLLSASPDKDERREADRLDALAAHLVSSGFSVIRNPAPFAKRTLWYNNTIIQSDPMTVWLPQYATLDGSFAAADIANVEIWTRLGFTVIGVPGWLAFLGSSGAVRCATNVLQRSPPAP